jgi:hypothetical protein
VFANDPKWKNSVVVAVMPETLMTIGGSKKPVPASAPKHDVTLFENESQSGLPLVKPEIEVIVPESSRPITFTPPVLLVSPFRYTLLSVIVPVPPLRLVV